MVIFSLMGLLLAFMASCHANQIRVTRASINLLNLVETTPFQLSDGINQFNNKLMEKLAENNDGNIVFSPFSLHTALSMVLIGSPNYSDTYKELANALYGGPEIKAEYILNYLKLLNFYSTQDLDVKIKVANRAFAAEGLKIKANYTEYLRNFFHSTLERLDFEDPERSAKAVNGFVEDATNGLIDEIVQPSTFTPLTRLILINAIYFKANWQLPFKRAETAPLKFRVNKDLETTYPYGMKLKAKLSIADMKNDGLEATIVSLPYENENFRMLLILPKNDDDDIADINLNQLNFESLEKSLFTNDAIIFLPRFKEEFEANMATTLKELGIKDLFDMSKANLRDLSDSESLHVTDVLHKTVVEVNEEGSEAAAVTSVQIDTRISNLQQRIIEFNRPFFFIIQDTKHKVPLFVGRITDPSGTYGLNSKPALETLRQESFDCDELGFNTNGNNGAVALPCKGQNTFPLRDFE